MDYGFIKTVHISCVLLSGLGFAARSWAASCGSGWVRQRWARVLPHVLDSVLLGSAVSLALHIQQYPFVHAWLTAKVLGLLLYIVLGAVSLRHGRSKTIRRGAGGLALLVFGYIVSVALSKQAAGFLSL